MNGKILSAAILCGVLAQAARAQDLTTVSEERDATETKEGDELTTVTVEGKFIEQGAQSAMKQDVRVLDTPFSVSNYSASFMSAVETTNIADLYNYMNGVKRGGVSGYDLSIRGFKTTQADKGAILVDGLPGLSGRFGSPPTFAAERVEVVKGPASVLYGQAQPGGFVNIVSKKPQAKAAALIDVRGSGFAGAGLSAQDTAGYTVDADFTGPFDSQEKVLYRLVAEYTDKDTFRGGREKSRYAAPSVTWRITDSTILTAAYEYRKRENAYDNQLVAPGKDARLIAPITTRYQEPVDLQNEKGQAASLSLSHYFANDVKLRADFRHVAGEDSAQGFDNVAVLANLTTLQRRARQQVNKRGYDFFDGNVAVPFNTGPVEHQVLIGVNGGVDTTDFDRVQFFNGPTTGAASLPGPGRINIDIYNPVYGNPLPLASYPLGPVNRRYTRSTSKAAYVSDLITFSERWKSSVGLRYSDERQVMEERKTPPLTHQEISMSDVLPTFGLMYEPTKQWTLYTSYATSFVPQGAGVQDAAGNNSFSPQKGKQIEVGMKSDLLEHGLTTTVALFRIRKENTLAPIACNVGVGGTCSQQVGAERSQGVELEVNYAPLENLQILGGLAYTDAIIDETFAGAAAPLAGATLTNSAKRSANLWTRYDVHEGELRGLGIGAGVFYSSAIPGSLPSTGDPRVLFLPSYTVADLAFYYTVQSRFDFTLKLGNVFDRRYFEGVNSTTNEIGVVPGAPRNITLSLRVSLW